MLEHGLNFLLDHDRAHHYLSLCLRADYGRGGGTCFKKND